MNKQLFLAGLLVLAPSTRPPSAQTPGDQTPNAPATAVTISPTEAEVVKLLKEAKALKKDKKFREGAEKLRAILPLCSKLPTRILIQSDEALKELLLDWEIADAEQSEQGSVKMSDIRRAISQLTTLLSGLKALETQLIVEVRLIEFRGMLSKSL